LCCHRLVLNSGSNQNLDRWDLSSVTIWQVEGTKPQVQFRVQTKGEIDKLVQTGLNQQEPEREIQVDTANGFF